MSKSYEWADKTKACQLYMLNGNMRIVSEVTEIPYDTLTDWKRSDWWPTLVEEMRAAKRAKTGVKLSKIIDTSLEVLQDRLENGDWVLNNKTGEMQRRPVSLRDAQAATSNLLTRQLQMEEIADKMENNKTTVQETLTLLAKEFQKMTRQKQKQEALEVEYKETLDAIHEERETGLQEGSGSVHIETRSEEEES